MNDFALAVCHLLQMKHKYLHYNVIQYQFEINGLLQN